MKNIGKFIFFIFIICNMPLFGQDRFKEIENTLMLLATKDKGLKEPVEISVTGVSIQEFVRALSYNNNLNISIDPSLGYIVYNNFSRETPINILIFLCKQYNLEIETTGSIIHLKPYNKPTDAPQPKTLQVSYNSFTQLVSMDLSNDTLKNVVKELVNLTKKNIVLAPGLENKSVNVYLQDMNLEAALKNIAYANNLEVSKSGENVFFISADQAGSVNSTGMQMSSPYKPYTKNKALDLSIDTVKGKPTISLTAYDVPIKEVVQLACDKLGKNYFIYSDIKGNISLAVQSIPLEKLLDLLFNNTLYTYRVENNIYLFGERNLEQIRTTKVYQLKYRSSKDMEILIPAQYKNNIEIKPFTELNSIVISGAGPQIKEIDAFLNEIDRQVPMIHIEIVIMEVRKGKKISSGVSAGISDKPVKTQGSILPGLDMTISSSSINDFMNLFPGNKLFNMGRVSSNFYLSLKAMEENENVKIYSTPMLSTLNGHEASLKIGEKSFYAIDQRDVIGSLNPQTVFTRTFQETNADLKIIITPMLSGDSSITMNVNVEESNFTQPAVQGGPPGLSSRIFKSEIRVKDMDMVVLGGLHKTENSNSGTGLPLLSRIPVLKWFFGNRNKVKSNSQLVLFIKPTIIY